MAIICFVISVPITWSVGGAFDGKIVIFGYDLLTFFDEIANTNPMDAMKKYKGELLVMAGDADFLVPMPHCEEVAATNEKAELVIYEGADHNFNVMTEDKSVSEDLLKTTAEWLAEHL